ncbi:uncharacterized protein AKAME5_001701900 [Lates japonicus]|uniref:Uncharacterized protein n=1 Tax=Lates japonicus TaxID=270547 RepID=A0AAD3N130_LATJO|nr:uncharacterized protein AKAME5_001701900 [Lates japonicus]
MKKAAHQYAKEVIEETRKDFSDDDDGIPASKPSKPKKKVRLLMEPAQSDTEEQEPGKASQESAKTEQANFQEFKKLKTMIRAKRDQESMSEYLKEVWGLVESCTSREEAIRLWLAHVISQPVRAGEPVREHYQKLVLEDLDDEDAHIEKARARVEQEQSLAQV